MSAEERGVARVSGVTADRLVVTCEHASNALPKQYGRLGVSAAVLRSHVAWDPGAREIAATLAHRFGCPYFAGRQSRLLVDLNRNRGNKRLIPTELFGTKIPGNRRLSRKERELRIAKYYAPYREMVLDAIRQAVERSGVCFHLSVHSFTPKLGDEVRDAEVGLLYDPRRKAERQFVARMRDHLESVYVVTRLNYPYQGTADGLTSFCRKKFLVREYRGIEIEINQRVLEGTKDKWRMGRVLGDAVIEALEL